MQMGNKRTRLVSISGENHSHLKSLAKKRRTSMRKILDRLLKGRRAVEQFDEIRAEMLPAVRDSGIETDQQVYGKMS